MTTSTTIRTPRPSGRWAQWGERLLFSLLAVGVVSLGIQRLTADDPDPTPRAPAAVTTLAGTASELEQRSQRDPGDPATWQKLTQVYIQRAAQTLDPSFYQRAGTTLARARELAPEQGATLAAAAALSAALHHFAEARAEAQQALELDPYDSAALAVLVDAEIELGDYDAAERSLQLFADRRPGAPVLSRVSYLRELHGDGDGARAAMTEARQAAAGADPFQRATLAAYDGDLLLGQGDRRGAAEAYREALELEPRHPIATVGRAKVLAADGKRTEAIDLLAGFVDRTPVPAAATLLGELQRLEGREADAEQSFDLVRALSQLEAAAGVDVDLDLALFEADRSVVSEATVATARAAFADRGTVYGADALAWTLFRAGDVAEARQILERSLALGTRDPLLRFHAAAIKAAAGDSDGARAELQIVLDTNPWFSFGLQPEARVLATGLGMTWPSPEVES